MKPPIKSLADPQAFLEQDSRPEQGLRQATPKVSRQKTAKVLSAAERAAFLASRPDLAKKS
ncbi:MAG: hypothetical protein WDN45_01245 [Caulobacteraceae bacterium]